MLGYLNSISKWVCLVFHSWICSVSSTNLPQSPFLMCFPNQLLQKKGRPLPGWSSPGSAGDVLQPHGEIPRWTSPTSVFPKNKVGSGLPTLPTAQRGDLQPGGAACLPGGSKRGIPKPCSHREGSSKTEQPRHEEIQEGKLS